MHFVYVIVYELFFLFCFLFEDCEMFESERLRGILNVFVIR